MKKIKNWSFLILLFVSVAFAAQAFALEHEIKLKSGFQYKFVLNESGDGQIFSRYKNDGQWQKAFEGNIQSFPLDSSETRSKSEPEFMQRALDRLSPNAETAPVEVNGRWHILAKGLVITLPETYDSNENFFVSDIVKNKDDAYVLVSTDGEQSGTFLIRLSDRKLVYISREPIQNHLYAYAREIKRKLRELEQEQEDPNQQAALKKHIGEIEKAPVYINSHFALSIKNDIFNLKFLPRAIDLQKNEMQDAFALEADFVPSITPEFSPSANQGRSVDPATWVLKQFDDVRHELENTPPIVLERDRENIIKLSEIFKRPKKRAAVIEGEIGSGRTTLAMNFLKTIPRTWPILDLNGGALQAGAAYAGFEKEKIQGMILANRRRPIMWFIKEFSHLNGHGSHSANPGADVINDFVTPIRDGNFMVLATDTKDAFQEAFKGRPKVRDVFNPIDRSNLSKSEQDAIIDSWYTFNKLPRPESDVFKRIEYLTHTYDRLSASPGKEIDLHAKMHDIAQRDHTAVPTVEHANKAIQEARNLDVTLLNPQSARDLLKKFPAESKKLVIGQEMIMEFLFDQAEAYYSGLHDGNSVSIAAIFPGPPGTGKSESGKSLAKLLKREEKLLPMNNFLDPNTVPDLMEIIADQLVKDPFTVFILDEIEKCPIEVQNALLGMLNDGVFTAQVYADSSRTKKKEVKVAAEHAIVIGTSNAAEYVISNWKKDNPETTHVPDTIIDDVKASMIHEYGMSSAFLDRFFVVPALPPTKRQFADLLRLKLDNRIRFLRKNHRQIVWDAEDYTKFINGLTEQFYNGNISNREVQRRIKMSFDRELSRQILWDPAFDHPDTAKTKQLRINTVISSDNKVSCKVLVEDLARTK